MDVCSGISARCAKCGADKPITCFHRQGKRGHHAWCKDCYNANARANRKRRHDPEQRRRNNLWSRYRLRPEDADALLSASDGVCAICGDPPDRPVIDHDHDTGHVRGILCHRCNIALPAVEDADWLAAALHYLGRRS